jgi:CheY-like chemotaxis protein
MINPPPPPLFGLSILIVDDNPVVLHATRAGAFHLGLAVECVDSGERALQVLRAHPVDAVLMDLQMPGRSGIETSLAIRALGVSWADLPIIAISATTSDAERARCRAAGMNACLEKPLPPRRLAATLMALFAPGGTAARRPQHWVDTDLSEASDRSAPHGGVVGHGGSPLADHVVDIDHVADVDHAATFDPVARARLDAAVAEQMGRGGATHPLTQALLRAAARPQADPTRPVTLSGR